MSTETDELRRKYYNLRGITFLVSFLAVVFCTLMMFAFYATFQEAARADAAEEAAGICEELLDRNRTEVLVETWHVEQECSEAARRCERRTRDYEDCLRDQALSDLYWHACERRLLQREVR